MAGKGEDLGSKKRPVACVGALIEGHEGTVFLAKGKKWGGKWVIPGGDVEHGEKLEDALKRGVREETGLEIKPLHILYVKDCIYPSNYYRKKHFLIIDYLCTLAGGKQKINEEFTECVWIKAEDAVKKLDIDEYTICALETYLKLKGLLNV